MWVIVMDLAIQAVIVMDLDTTGLLCLATFNLADFVNRARNGQ